MAFEMSFGNYMESYPLTLDYNAFHYGDTIGAGLSSAPTNPLLAGGGFQTVSAYFSVTALHSDVDLYCCWLLPSPGPTQPIPQYRFGVWMHFPKQMFGIGTAPSWQVMSDNLSGSAPTDWSSSGGNPADSYTWPSFSFPALQEDGSTQLVTLTIVGRPTASNDSLSVTVGITSTLTPIPPSYIAPTSVTNPA